MGAIHGQGIRKNDRMGATKGSMWKFFLAWSGLVRKTLTLRRRLFT
jgi:hypothetical protein